MVRSEQGEHAAAHGKLDQRLAARWQALMIAAEPTPAHDPGEGALHHPPSGLRAEAFGKQGVPIDLFPFGNQHAAFGKGEGLDRLHAASHNRFDPEREGARIMTISPDQFEPREPLFSCLQQAAPALLIRFVGPRDFDGQQMALGIHQRVPLAPPNFFFSRRSLSLAHEPRWFSPIGYQ